MTQLKLLADLEEDEIAYLEIFKTWLLNEQGHIEEITPILEKIKNKEKIDAIITQPPHILCISANPIPEVNDDEALRLEDEMRIIKDSLERGTLGNAIKLTIEPSVKISDLTRAVQKKKASIIHFMGHGSGEDGIILLDEFGYGIPVLNDTLERLFRLVTESLKCIVLNACYSKSQAECLSKLVPWNLNFHHIELVLFHLFCVEEPLL